MKKKIEDISKVEEPMVAYNVANIKVAFEYELTDATYGTIVNTGRVTNPYSVTNHRALASICYNF